MNAAKIRLSQAEMELVKNADWILTKNSILGKIKEMLGKLVYLQQEMLEENIEGEIPVAVRASSYKITMGENYQGLPWLVLDHPRFFAKEDVMAIRTLFWWGRCFSVTLHLAGQYKSLFEKAILSHYDTMTRTGQQDDKGLMGKEYYVCVNANQWEHHFEEDNYRLVQDLRREEWLETITGKPFIKLAKKIPLEQWEGPYNMNDVLAWHYYTLAALLGPTA